MEREYVIQEVIIMEQCKECGTAVEDGVTLCPKCGADMTIQKGQSAGERAFDTREEEQPQQDDLSSKVANLNNTADSTQEFTKEDIEKNKVMGILAYILFFIPLLAAKDSPFARYHANQGLVLFIFGFGGGLILSLIPILGWIIAPIFSVLVTVLAVIGIINVANGRAKELPLIGKFKLLK